MVTLAPLDLSVLTYPEWLRLAVAMDTALGSARSYADLFPDHFDSWHAEMLDVHYDVLSLQGKPHAPEPGQEGGRQES